MLRTALLLGGLWLVLAPPPEPMPIGGEVTAPVIVKSVQPKWLEMPRRERILIYSLTVTRAGRVKDLRQIKGQPDRLAEEAIRQWRFKPGTYHGKPVDVRYTLSLTVHAR